MLTDVANRYNCPLRKNILHAGVQVITGVGSICSRNKFPETSKTYNEVDAVIKATLSDIIAKLLTSCADPAHPYYLVQSH